MDQGGVEEPNNLTSDRLYNWEETVTTLSRGALLRVRCYQQVSSTMDCLPRIYPECEGDNVPVDSLLLVLAAEQLAGRGTRQREWISPLGGLWGTWFYLTDAGEAAWQGVTITIGGVVRDLLSEVVATDGRGGDAFRVKWPNDILLSDSGEKVAGILVEHRRGVLSVGVGINVDNQIGTVDGATSLAKIVGDGRKVPRAIDIAGELSVRLKRTLKDFVAGVGRG